ncbi:MAG TPA: chitobiase/beta-hexosaminidase C-terminal domain-containing protein, partial [Prevotella sp.]
QAQTYCQPSGLKPNWSHANSQSFYSLEAKSGENVLLSYTDANCDNAYNWLQADQIMKVSKGQELKLDIRSGIWTWEIQVGFDWDGDGSFEDIQRAFSTPGETITEATSSWGHDPYKVASERTAMKNSLGHRGVVQHTFTFTVPADAKEGMTRVRILCDGDGGGVPSLDMCSSVGYAGSMHDFGVEVVGQPIAAMPVADVKGGVYKANQDVKLTTTTPDASIYYTLDGSEPTADNGTLYAGGVNVAGEDGVTKVVILKAIAVKDGMTASGVLTEIYTMELGWSIPGGSIHPTEERYITSATTTGAKSELNYTQSSKPSQVYIDTKSELTVTAGSTFNIHVVSTPSMKWEHAIIFADWNHNYSFDDASEQVVMVGEEKKGVEAVADFERTISVPADATVGKTRLRIQYTDAWHKKDIPGHTHSGNDAVEKGGVYDFILNIEAAETTGISAVQSNGEAAKLFDVYTIEGKLVKANATNMTGLKQGIYVVNGKKVVVK